MKIRPLSPETLPKAAGLLRQVFGPGSSQLKLFEELHREGRQMQEWVCLHVNGVIGYISFTNAYHGRQVCGLQLALLAIKPEFQSQGVGSELLRFALRQSPIREQPLFVLGEAAFFSRFGFAECSLVSSAKPKRKKQRLLGLRENSCTPCTIGFEPEFG